MGRILIADDEETILEVMVDILESAGHQVVGVSDGQAALEQLKSHTFDVVLADVMMPKIDGYHLAQQIYSLQNRPRIVMVTSRDFDSDKRAVQAVGADAFLQKPFANRELLEVVTRLINNPAT